MPKTKISDVANLPFEANDQAHAAKVTLLDEALDAGDASSDAPPGAFERVKLRIRHRAEAQ